MYGVLMNLLIPLCFRRYEASSFYRISGAQQTVYVVVYGRMTWHKVRNSLCSYAFAS